MTPIMLESTRLILRCLTLQDTSDYFEFASDPDVVKFIRWGPHKSTEDTTEYLNEVIKSDDARFLFGIELKETKKLIGILHFYDVTYQDLKASFGIVLNKKYWHQGYATEAAHTGFRYIFEELKLNRIDGVCILPNIPAAKFAQHLGMQQEGILRDYAIEKNKVRSFYLFSMLRNEYTEM